MSDSKSEKLSDRLREDATKYRTMNHLTTPATQPEPPFKRGDKVSPFNLPAATVIDAWDNGDDWQVLVQFSDGSTSDFPASDCTLVPPETMEEPRRGPTAFDIHEAWRLSPAVMYEWKRECDGLKAQLATITAERDELRTRLADAEAENTRYRKRYGCLTCVELHDRDSVCPPHEVRSSAMTDADRLALANAKLAEAERERDEHQAARQLHATDLAALQDGKPVTTFLAEGVRLKIERLTAELAKEKQLAIDATAASVELTAQLAAANARVARLRGVLERVDLAEDEYGCVYMTTDRTTTQKTKVAWKSDRDAALDAGEVRK